MNKISIHKKLRDAALFMPGFFVVKGKRGIDNALYN